MKDNQHTNHQKANNMCYYTRVIKNRKYTKTKKNEGLVPSLQDKRVEYIPIGCGKCKECKKQKANEWRVRLIEDIRENKNGKFIALTFSDKSILEIMEETITRKKKKLKGDEVKENGLIISEKETIKIGDLKGYEKDNAIATWALRKFNEDWRYKYGGKALRHWCVTELGHRGTENIHIHGIVWTNETFQAIRETWKYGYIYPRPHEEKYNYVAQDSISYIVKYVQKIDKQHKEYNQIILSSPGIGGSFRKSIQAKKIMEEANTGWHDNDRTETFRTSTGHTIGLPIYYRNMVFNEEEREKLWIKRLDKEERWVDGVRYDISTPEGQENHKRALQEARRNNAELGYGSGKNDNRKSQEEELRELNINKRIERAKLSHPKQDGIGAEQRI